MWIYDNDWYIFKNIWRVRNIRNICSSILPIIRGTVLRILQIAVKRKLYSYCYISHLQHANLLHSKQKRQFIKSKTLNTEVFR